MEAVHFNYPAILVATLLAFVIGGLWYSPFLFARAWMRGAGVDEAELRQSHPGKVFGLAFVAYLVMAFNFSAFLGSKATIGFGALAGFATGLGWVAMALAVIYLFERRSTTLWLINAGCQVVTCTAMGAVIGGWR